MTMGKSLLHRRNANQRGTPKVDRASEAQAAVFRSLETRRSGLGVTALEWSRAAAVGRSTIYRLQAGEAPVMPSTLAKLKRGLDVIEAGRTLPPTYSREAVKALLAGLQLAACHALGVSPDIAISLDPATGRRGAAADEATRLAHRARHVAIYVANVQVGISQAAIASALDIDKAAISRAIGQLEDAREDGDFDAAVQRAARLMDQGDVW